MNNKLTKKYKLVMAEGQHKLNQALLDAMKFNTPKDTQRVQMETAKPQLWDKDGRLMFDLGHTRYTLDGRILVRHRFVGVITDFRSWTYTGKEAEDADNKGDDSLSDSGIIIVP